ncbi:hypothetical protein BO94DRAFT_321678 [Aspergillus sclerotioniger CBS 115572]|uniref:Tautomerase cis-CaaD-like domain-containing protein n=1 Tax=Aspergillus sclerotioniger CBS 115572 TaxID=1450535 RepID=A0A317X7G0_9EURO|nr:hypothetical protein BO94DRAFT_321678 [Aspergillus sclerotioniger CBS 115572]PWY94131.1 hypothetical protein BO94DRAFT_321678 [Aspergillus sclerotioniger CBS 115572]
MPLYEVAHAASLSPGQKDSLAEAITDLHANRFKVPRWYINVTFTDASVQTSYIGGRQRITNRITARVRNGSTRSREAFNELCSDINDAWRRIVHLDLPTSTLPPRELELAAIYITGELLAGMKFGFQVPAAGSEMAWSEIHHSSFKARAALGDEDFVEFVAGLEKKPGFNRST